jgi:hypothetical protein
VEELRNDGIDVCSFFCCNCIKNIEKEEFKVNRFVINGEEFF